MFSSLLRHRLGPAAAIITVLLLAATGCGSVSTFQTGRTAGKGNLRTGLGTSILFIDNFSVLTGVDEQEETEVASGVPVPSLEVWARYGLARNVDVGLRLYTLGISGEFKAQFAGSQTSPFAASLGAVVNYFGYSTPEEAEQEEDEVTFGGRIGILDVITVLYLSYSVHDEWFNFYLAPKYISRSVILGASINGKGAEGAIGLDLVGSSLGIAVGRDFSFYLEGGLFTPIGFRGVMSNFGIGFDF